MAATKFSTGLRCTAVIALVALAGCAKQQDDTPRPDLTPLKRVVQTPRLTPDFAVAGASARSLRAFRGQAVVLVLADSPKTGAFRKQLRKLEDAYSEFASRQSIFIAAFRDGSNEAVKSNIPFVLAANGPATCDRYALGKEKFSIAIIGPDGNLDYQTEKVLPGERVRDVIQNSFAVQTGNRKRN